MIVEVVPILDFEDTSWVIALAVEAIATIVLVDSS